MMNRAYVFIVANLLPVLAYAASDDPFAKPTNILNKIIEFVAGPFAAAVLTLAIMVVGFLTFKGRIPAAMGWSVVAGGVIIGTAAQIANFILAG